MAKDKNEKKESVFSQVYKSDIIDRVIANLKSIDYRKPVKIRRRVFTITDEDGQMAEFTVKPRDKYVQLSIADVEAVVTATIEEIVRAISRGEEVSLRGFGQFKFGKRAARRALNVFDDKDTRKYYEIPEHYTLKFLPGLPFQRAIEGINNVYKEAAIESAELREAVHKIFEDDDDDGTLGFEEYDGFEE